MRFAFNEEQQMFQDSINGALGREISIEKVRAWTKIGDFSEYNKFCFENGLTGLGFAEEHGGQGGGLIELAILFELLGKHSAPSGRVFSNFCTLSYANLVTGTAELCARALEGELVPVLCLSASQPLDTSAPVTVTGEKINGRVPLVLDAEVASEFIVPIEDETGLGLWQVQASQDAIQLKKRPLIDQTRLYADVILDNAEASYFGHVAKESATKLAAKAAVLIAAESLGLSEKMLDMTVDYVKQRVQFDVVVGSFQAVKHKAAEIFVDIQAAYSGIFYAAWALENDADDALQHAWVAKAFMTESAVVTADRALSLHGAIGYTWEYDLHLYYKRAKSNQSLLGSPRLYRDRLASLIDLLN